RVLLRRAPGRGRAARAPAGPVVRGADPALRRDDDRAGHAGAPAALPTADGVVSEVSPDDLRPARAPDPPRRARAAAAGPGRSREAPGGDPAPARPLAVPLRLWPAVAVAEPGRRAVRLPGGSGRLRAGRIGLAALRRQFQLAWADLVPR